MMQGFTLFPGLAPGPEGEPKVFIWDLIAMRLEENNRAMEQLISLLSRSRPGQPAQLIAAIPGQVEPRAPHQELLFARQQIRNTTLTVPKAMLMVPTKHWSVGFLISNNHNQQGSFQLTGALSNDSSTAGAMGGPDTVELGVTDFMGVHGDLWAPYMGLEVTYATAPTSGQLHVVGIAIPPD